MADAGGLLQQAQEAAKAREYERALEIFDQVSGRASRPTRRGKGWQASVAKPSGCGGHVEGT